MKPGRGVRQGGRSHSLASCVSNGLSQQKVNKKFEAKQSKAKQSQTRKKGGQGEGREWVNLGPLSYVFRGKGQGYQEKNVF
jgi:hypothetical protein